MMRSMFSAVSGLRNHQTYMDVVGNNIANINTTGFRASRVAFQDVLSQTLRQATGPYGDLGGLNPVQIGLGVALASIDQVQTQGALQSTGKITDLALEGDGYFILGDGNGLYYSRDGAFDRGIDGSLVNAVGLKVMGWQAVNGVVDTSQPLTAITLPIGQDMRAYTSEHVNISGNLDAATAVGASASTDVSVRDSLGNGHLLTITFTRNAALNTWDWEGTVNGASVGTGTITFDGNGAVSVGGTGTVSIPMTNGATDPLALEVDFSALKQLAGLSEVQATADGAPAGSLTTFVIDSFGVITGVYSNGVRETLAQIAVAKFANPGGLVKVGGNLLEASMNSGTAQLGTAGTGGRATLAAGFLEMSNVDLAQQFTNLIMAERGFQANSRVISASDEILQDLVNLVR